MTYLGDNVYDTTYVVYIHFCFYQFEIDSLVRQTFMERIPLVDCLVDFKICGRTVQ